MCGRYVTVTKIKEIEKRFGVTAPKVNFEPNANVGAGQFAPVITGEKPGELQFYRFGFTPHWAKKNTLVLNARTEGDHNASDDPLYRGAKGILEKPMFRKAIRSQRCLVVADAFIEGPKEQALSKPYVVYLRDGEKPFAFAGIWDQWQHITTGELLHSFAILTTAGNELMDKIGHHRCPLILPRDAERAWLDNRTPLSEVTDMMQIFSAKKLNAYPISAAIKSPKDHSVHLLEPIGERLYPEYTYEVYQDLKMFGMGETRSRERRDNGQLNLFG